MHRLSLNDYESGPQMEKLLCKRTEELADYRVKLPEGRSGPWKVEKFLIPGLDLQQMRYLWEGRASGVGKFTRLVHDKRGVIMSDTIAEVEDLMSLLINVSGSVLISGLGLGMAVKALLRKKAVTSITVLENDPDIFTLVAKHYRDERVNIIEADAFTWKPDTRQKFDWAWHDIWFSISDEEHRQMGVLRNRYARYMYNPGRQLCWGDPLKQSRRYG